MSIDFNEIDYSAVWQKAFILLAILTGAMAGAAVALKSPRVASNIKARIQKMARSRWGLRVELERLSLHLVPLAVSADGVRVYRPDQDTPWIAAHYANIAVRPWPSATGALVFSDVEIDGLRTDIELDLEAEAGPGQKSRLPIDVQQMVLWNADLRVNLGGTQVDVRRADVVMTPQPRGGRSLQVSIPEGQVTHQGVQHPFELKAGGTLKGSLDRPGDLVVERSFLFLHRMRLESSGLVQLEDKARASLKVQAQGQLEDLPPLGEDLPELRGQVRINAEFNLREEAQEVLPMLRLEIESEDIWVASHHLGNVMLNGIYKRGQVQIESLRCTQKELGAITGSVTLDLNPSLDLSFNTRISHASLPHILEMGGIEDPWVKLWYSADVRGRGRLKPLHLELETDGTVEEFWVHDRSFRAKEAEVYLYLPPTQLGGEVQIDADATRISNVRIGRARSQYRVDGTLWHDTRAGLDLRVQSDDTTLEDFGEIGGVPFGGTGTVAATVQGPYDDIAISATAEIDDFEALGYYGGHTKATVIFSRLIMEVDRLQASHRGGTIIGGVVFDFREETTQVAAELEVENIPALEPMLIGGMPPEWAERFDALVTGRATLKGPIALPNGDVALRSRALTFDGSSLGPANIRARFGPHRPPWIDFRSRPRGGELRTQTTFYPALGEDAFVGLDLDIDARRVPMVALQPFIGGTLVGGLLTAQVSMAGPADKLSGEVRAFLEEGTFYDLRLGRVEAVGSSVDGRLSLTGKFLHDRSAFRTIVDVGAQLPFTATASFADLDVTKVYDLPLGAEMRGAGSMFAQGDLTQSESINADVEVEMGKLSLGQLRLSPVRTVRIHYGRNRFDIRELSLAGSGVQLSMAGTVPLSGSMNVHLRAVGDLGSTSASLHALDTAQGPMDLDVQIVGAFGSPQLNGKGTIRNATATIRGTDLVLERMNTDINFLGSSVEIRRGSAMVGDGNIRFAGEIGLPVGAPPNFNLRSQFQSVSSHPSPGLDFIVTGNVDLTGPVGDLKLHGDVTIDQLHFTRNIAVDIDSFLPKRDAPLRVRTFSPENAVDLDINVQAPNNLLVSGSQLEAEFTANLRVTGTTNHIGLKGNLAPIWAKARYNDIDFTVESAAIDFQEEIQRCSPLQRAGKG